MMLRYLFFALIVIIGAGLVSCALWVGGGIPFSQQWPLYEALRGTAAIIFAVVGAWLAIIYPERLKLSFGKKANADAGNSNSKVELLLTPAIHSTILLVILLLIGVIVPMLKQINSLLAHVDLLRSLSFGTLVFLTYWQAAIVVIAIFPAELVQSTIAREKAEEQIRGQHGKLFKKRDS